MSIKPQPTPNVDTFNNLYWDDNTNVSLTTAEGDARYLRFPTAQGTENLQAINVNGAADFNNTVNVDGVATFNGNAFMNNSMNMGNTNIINFNTITGNNNTNVSLGSLGTGDLQLFTAGVNRIAIDDTGLTTVNGPLKMEANMDLSDYHITNVGEIIGTNDTDLPIKALGTGDLQLFTAGVNRLNITDAGNLTADTKGLYIEGNTNEDSKVRLGLNTGSITQGIGSISIGGGAGTTQGTNSIAIGQASGILQTLNSIAIGNSAGASQNNQSIAIGKSAGASQNSDTIALGNSAGASQGINSIAIGLSAGESQGTACISIGQSAGETQGNNSIAIGTSSGPLQGLNSISIGPSSGTSQGNNSIAMGTSAGLTSQVNSCIAIGNVAGKEQGTGSTAIGFNAGFTSQGNNAIAIGTSAGRTQDINAIAIGIGAATDNLQGADSIAIGFQAGKDAQGERCIAIGYQAGVSTQKEDSIFIGRNAGNSGGGLRSIYIGTACGTTSTLADSILLSTKSAGYNPTGSSGFYVNPNNLNNANATALHMNGQGEITRATSSARYKTDITYKTRDTSVIHQLNPVEFRYKEQYENTTSHYGYIAEDVELIDNYLVIHNEEGLPDALYWDRIHTYNICEVQKLRKEVDEMKSVISTLIEEINILKNR